MNARFGSLRAFYDSIWSDVRASGETNIVALGFGTAVKNGLADLERSRSVHFYVRRKNRRRHKYEVPITLPWPHDSILADAMAQTSERRRGKRKRLELPTDVIECPVFVPAGRRTYMLNNGSVTSGLVVRWQQANVARPGVIESAYGVVTVAHAFLNEHRNTEVYIEGPFGSSIVGHRVCQSDPFREGIDVCLIQFDVEQGMKIGLLADPLSDAMDFKTYADLQDDQNRVGASKQQNRTVSFRVIGTIQYASIAGLGERMQDLLHVQGGYGAFVEGTSGSLMGVLDHGLSRDDVLPSAIQIAADGATFSSSVGQSLETCLHWLSSELAIQLFRSGRRLVDNKVTPISRF